MKSESKILRPKNLKTLLYLLISILFVIMGYIMLDKKFLIGLFTIIFFGLGIIIFILQVIPNASYLKLTEDGFEIRSLFKSSFTKWGDIKIFKTGYIGTNKMVMLDYQDEHIEYRIGKKFAKTLSGSEGALPNTYGMPAETLAQLMNEWKSKHTI